MSRRAVHRLLLPIARALSIAGVAAVLSLPAPVAALTATTADDVCSPTADPCVISSAFSVAPGATLDFGTRAVEITGNGELDFGAGPGALLCGDLYVASAGGGTRIFIKQSGAGGRARLVARRSCSGNAALACRSDAVCAEAAAGTCTLGTGNLTIDGKIRGEGTPGASLDLVAAGDVSVSATINLSNGGSTPSQATGGVLTITSETGSVYLQGAAAVDLNGGGQAGGGTFHVSAAGDVVIDLDVNASGGDDGGGDVDVIAGDSVYLTADLRAGADQGDGLGGSVNLTADGDIVLAGLSGTNLSILDVDGHAATEESGSAGRIELRAKGQIVVGNHVLLRADGSGGSGGSGAAGMIELVACSVDVQAGAAIEATGEDGGNVDLTGFDQLRVDAASDVIATGVEGSFGQVSLLTRAAQVCSHDPSITCTSNADCSVGCNAYQCLINPDTGGTLAQFDPPPVVVELSSLRDCN